MIETALPSDLFEIESRLPDPFGRQIRARAFDGVSHAGEDFDVVLQKALPQLRQILASLHLESVEDLVHNRGAAHAARE